MSRVAAAAAARVPAAWPAQKASPGLSLAIPTYKHLASVHEPFPSAQAEQDSKPMASRWSGSSARSVRHVAWLMAVLCLVLPGLALLDAAVRVSLASDDTAASALGAPAAACAPAFSLDSSNQAIEPCSRAPARATRDSSWPSRVAAAAVASSFTRSRALILPVHAPAVVLPLPQALWAAAPTAVLCCAHAATSLVAMTSLAANALSLLPAAQVGHVCAPSWPGSVLLSARAPGHALSLAARHACLPKAVQGTCQFHTIVCHQPL